MLRKLFFLGCLTAAAACQPVAATPQHDSSPTSRIQTPPAPPSGTSDISSTGAFTQTPIPIFFSDDFSSDSGAWTSFQTGGTSHPTILIDQGLLRIDIASADTWFYAVHSAHEYDDVSIDAKFSATPAGSVGIICRYSGDGWYEFDIASDGTYDVLFGQWLSDGIARYTPIKNDASEYLTPGTLDYEIGLGCQQNVLLLYINGKLFRKLDVTRFGLTSGKAGLAIASFGEVPMIASFDYFKIDP